jgi:hypothetical protein
MFGIREVWVTRHGLCWSPIPRLARDRRGTFAVYSTVLQSRMIFILVWPKFLVRVQMMTCDRRKVSLLHLPVFDLDDDSHSQSILRHTFRHFLRGLCYVNSHQLSRSRFIRLPTVSVSSSIIYLVNIQQLRAVIADAVSAIDSWTRRGQRIGHLGRS